MLLVLLFLIGLINLVWSFFFLLLFFLTHLVRSSVCLLLPLNPPDHQETVEEVRLDNIREKRGAALLVDQSHNVITDVSFSL